MQTPLINIIIMGIAAFISLTVIVYWHTATRGTWKEWPAGRSLMGLLAIIHLAFTYGVVSTSIGPQGFPAKPYITFTMYSAFVVALSIIGLTIRREITRGREDAKPPTGPITITIATEKEPL